MLLLLVLIYAAISMSSYRNERRANVLLPLSYSDPGETCRKQTFLALICFLNFYSACPGGVTRGTGTLVLTINLQIQSRTFRTHSSVIFYVYLFHLSVNMFKAFSPLLSNFVKVLLTKTLVLVFLLHIMFLFNKP